MMYNTTHLSSEGYKKLPPPSQTPLWCAFKVWITGFFGVECQNGGFHFEQSLYVGSFEHYKKLLHFGHPV